MKKHSGSITIYLSIILISVILLINVITEMARINAVKAKCKAATDISTESIMAGYGRQILDEYGLLLVWENESAKERLESYLQANINLANVNGQGSNFMATDIVQIEKCDVGYITDDNGKRFVNQVRDYLTYAGSLKIAQTLIEDFNAYSEKNESENDMEDDAIHTVDEEDEGLSESVNEIEGIIVELKDVEELKELLDDADKASDNLNKFKKKHKKLIKILSEKKEKTQEAIDLIEEYKKEKKEFLNEYGYSDNESDYVSVNLSRLEIIRDKITEIEELDVSHMTSEDADKEEIINQCLSNSEEIITEIDALVLAEITEEDLKNKSLYDSAVDLFNKGIIALVTEDSHHISQNAIIDANLPSDISIKNETNLLEDKAMLLTYANIKFGNYLLPSKGNALKYEMEYLLNGKDSDSDNLAATIEKLVLTRNGINLIVLLTDKDKMSTISAVATSAATAMSAPYLEIVIKAILIEAWALSESIYEVKVLMKGWKLPLVKTKNKWNTEIDQLFKKPEEKEFKKGIDYNVYCNFLLMLQTTETIAYRMMDLIQVNIRKKYNGEFLIKNCFTDINARVQFETKEVFVAMPWMLGVDNGSDGYTFVIEDFYSY